MFFGNQFFENPEFLRKKVQRFYNPEIFNNIFKDTPSYYRDLFNEYFSRLENREFFKNNFFGGQEYTAKESTFI